MASTIEPEPLGDPEPTPPSDDAQPGSPEPEAPPAVVATTAVDEDRPEPKTFAELGWRGRGVRVLAVAFLVLHLGSMLIGGAIAPIQKVFKPLVGLYADGLRMTNSWGMFGKPPTATNVYIEGVRLDGTTKIISTTNAHDRSLFQRIRDSRMRKFEGRLSEEGDRRRLGDSFLTYFCEVAKIELGKVREIRVVNVIHELKDDDGKVVRTPSTQIVLTRSCGERPPPHLVLPFTPRPAPGQPPPQSGGDL